MRNEQQAEWDARRPFNAPAPSAARNTGQGLPAPVPARPFSTPSADPILDNGRPRESPYPNFSIPQVFGSSFPRPPQAQSPLDFAGLGGLNTPTAPAAPSPSGDQRGPARPRPAVPGRMVLRSRDGSQEF